MVPPSLTVFAPSGALPDRAALRRAVRRLGALGFTVAVDPEATARHQRFAGSDDTRLAALHRVAAQAPAVALAARGGYGLTRLLDRIDWPLLARAAGQGTHWCGHSDFTALQLALLAHTGAPSWAGPMAVGDFGRPEPVPAAAGDPVPHKSPRTAPRTAPLTVPLPSVDEVTAGCFAEAMCGELEAVGFRTAPGFDGLAVRGRLWGGNLTVLCSLLGTRHWPGAARIGGGLLFLEDVNEHPYRVERMLLQLLQAGVLARQKALLLGSFTAWTRSPLDRGHDLRAVVAHLRAQLGPRVPVLTGLPFGHQRTLVTLPVGRRCDLLVQGREVLLGWGG
jgi:muramoyltetrapeptide carboxypeptidase